MSTIAIPCQPTLLPTPADTANIFKQVANIPSKLQVEVEKLKAEAGNKVQKAVREAILAKIEPYERKIEQINSILNSIEKILGNFPMSVSNPVYPGVKVPDMEWERRITALCNEYHLYVQAKIMEIINNVLPINFEIPILGISINPVRLFADPGYRADLKLQFAERAEFFMNLIPETYQTFQGTLGVLSRAMQADAIFAYVMSRLQAGALALIYDALGKLIEKFKTIWDALGLPPLPILLNLNVEGIINSVIGTQKARLKALKDRIENAPEEAKARIGEEMLEIQQKILEKLDSISIAGFKLSDILGGEVENIVGSIEQKIDRQIEAARNFGENWPQYLIKVWMKKVLKFFEEIGLSALTQWISFNFCQFLTLIGMPKSISIESGVPGIGVDVVINDTNLEPAPS